MARRRKWQCNLCNRTFRSIHALFGHCRDKAADHPFCKDCKTLFYDFAGLYQHMNNVHRSDSESDEYAFESDDIEDDYDNEDDYDDEEPPFCVGCNRWFVDLANLYQHLATSLKHNWCFLCSRDFATPTSLDQANLDFECPLCSKRFQIPSSIALHIQSGACHNISLAQVTAAVHALKIVPTTSVSRHIEGGSTRVASYYVTERAFNGTAYECYLCHLTFRTLGALNSHINSPVHDADEFKCPKCERKYKFVSGLMQHIESEACGIARFEVVEDFTMSLIDQLL
ncbi:uncharacterized protein F5147DRAFT_695632 [Suillus discolor]|uniref:C2H2-type domain-containing protein n=1 Tax=Suillus discolor TaxID=1912936 RepID=A0A9P7JTU1_9AGAM|nr:uncharacterized protein F5147DRAFT_695632 [Suillus discolor]KAG2107898.1 hypothetical protein F5147DRAFT_695632 [Suillus discolor]